MPSPAILSEYKGNKMIVLNPNDRFPFQFGLTKAKLILEPDNLAAIMAFVQSNGTSIENATNVAPNGQEMAPMAESQVTYPTDDNDNLV